MKNTVFFVFLWVSAGEATVVWLVHVIRVHSPLSTKFSTFLFSRKLNFIIEVTIDCIAQKHPEVFGRSSGDPVASSCAWFTSSWLQFLAKCMRRRCLKYERDEFEAVKFEWRRFFSFIMDTYSSKLHFTVIMRFSAECSQQLCFGISIPDYR